MDGTNHQKWVVYDIAIPTLMGGYTQGPDAPAVGLKVLAWIPCQNLAAVLGLHRSPCDRAVNETHPSLKTYSETLKSTNCMESCQVSLGIEGSQARTSR